MKFRPIARKLTIGAMLMVLPFSLGACSNLNTISPTGVTASVEDLSATIEVADNIVKGEELLCLVDSKEEAQKIADEYGITLVTCSYGVATFHTDEDPHTVIDRGLKAGYTELSLNTQSYAY